MMTHMQQLVQLQTLQMQSQAKTVTETPMAALIAYLDQVNVLNENKKRLLEDSNISI